MVAAFSRMWILFCLLAVMGVSFSWAMDLKISDSSTNSGFSSDTPDDSYCVPKRVTAKHALVPQSPTVRSCTPDGRRFGERIISPVDRPCTVVHSLPIEEVFFAAVEHNNVKKFMQCLSDLSPSLLEPLMELKNPDGFALLHSAAQHDRIRITTELVRFWHDINVQTPKGLTSLMLAARYQSKLAVKRGIVLEELLSAGADPRAQDSRGLTALHFAVHAGNTVEAVILVRKLKEIDATGSLLDMHSEACKYNATPLHVAAYKGNFFCTTLLLEAGADPLSLSMSEKTPLDIAKRKQGAYVIGDDRYREYQKVIDILQQAEIKCRDAQKHNPAFF